jgi:hypothetical protein
VFDSYVPDVRLCCEISLSSQPEGLRQHRYEQIFRQARHEKEGNIPDLRPVWDYDEPEAFARFCADVPRPQVEAVNREPHGRQAGRLAQNQ